MVNGYCYTCELLRPRIDVTDGIPHCPDCHGDVVEILATWDAIGNLERFISGQRQIPSVHLGNRQRVGSAGTPGLNHGEQSDSLQERNLPIQLRNARRGVELSFSFVTDGRTVLPLENFLQAIQHGSEPTMTPASPELIAQLREKARPAQEFNDFFRHVDGDVDNQCTICLGPMIEREMVTSLGCNHFFHLNCLLSWLEQQHTCPVCRAECDLSTV
mmetsp:Transcript_18955/g.29732  ORF Transcript_18955/g.29732 Transcript_18955/m.29732 type:complete len:216 (-) Transcript_18955:5-652(-)